MLNWLLSHHLLLVMEGRRMLSSAPSDSTSTAAPASPRIFFALQPVPAAQCQLRGAFRGASLAVVQRWSLLGEDFLKTKCHLTSDDYKYIEYIWLMIFSVFLSQVVSSRTMWTTRTFYGLTVNKSSQNRRAMYKTIPAGLRLLPPRCVRAPHLLRFCPHNRNVFFQNKVTYLFYYFGRLQRSIATEQ